MTFSPPSDKKLVPGPPGSDAAFFEKLEEVLRVWPGAEPGTETALSAIFSRFDTPPPAGSPDDQLLVAPMAEERDTSSPSQAPLSTDGKPSRRERRGFQEMAKLAGPPSARPSAVDEWKEDSGVVNLQAIQESVAASEAPAALPVEQEPTKPVVMAPVSAPPQAVRPGSAETNTLAPAVAASAPPAAPGMAAAAVAAPATMQEKKKGAPVVFIGGGVLAAAAALFLAFRPSATPPPVVPTATVTSAPQAAAPASTGTAAVADLAKPEETPSVDSLPVASPDKTKGAAVGTVAVAAGGAPAPAAATTDKTAKAAPAPTGPAPEPGSLAAAMAQAAGPIDPSKPVAGAAAQTGPVGNVPQRPSQGAVTGAMGKVLSAARACLKADDPSSRASVTFASGGAATSVSVSGPAAGTPAESCIKGALMRANVGAFAEPTYSTTVTVRH